MITRKRKAPVPSSSSSDEESSSSLIPPSSESEFTSDSDDDSGVFRLGVCKYMKITDNMGMRVEFGRYHLGTERMKLQLTSREFTDLCDHVEGPAVWRAIAQMNRKLDKSFVEK